MLILYNLLDLNNRSAGDESLWTFIFCLNDGFVCGIVYREHFYLMIIEREYLTMKRKENLTIGLLLIVTWIIVSLPLVGSTLFSVPVQDTFFILSVFGL